MCKFTHRFSAQLEKDHMNGDIAIEKRSTEEEEKRQHDDNVP